MRIFLLLAELALAQSALSSLIAERVVCAADNCARAVTGTALAAKPALSARQSDCSSFNKVTVTPATSTITATVTSTVTLSKRDVAATQHADPVLLRARNVTVVPSSVPTYASACSGSVRYSSACSCFGFPVTTITAAVPVTTLTVTATVSVCPSTKPFSCAGSCVDTQTDTNNCGYCGTICSSGQTCSAGICTSPVTNTGTCSQPLVCGTYAPNCGDSSLGCYCITNINGGGECVTADVTAETDEDGNPITCTQNSDCLAGDFCAYDTCLGNVCTLAQYDCVNSSNARRLFSKKRAAAGRRDGGSAFNNLLGVPVTPTSS